MTAKMPLTLAQTKCCRTFFLLV